MDLHVELGVFFQILDPTIHFYGLQQKTSSDTLMHAWTHGSEDCKIDMATLASNCNNVNKLAFKELGPFNKSRETHKVANFPRAATNGKCGWQGLTWLILCSTTPVPCVMEPYDEANKTLATFLTVYHSMACWS